MNSLLLFIIGIPVIEIMVIIKVGQQLGALSTILLIFITAFIGIYFARIEGINTVKAGLVNLYKNKLPVNEIISGASIALAALLLILPGFVTDFIGFTLLLPFTRNIIIKEWIHKKNKEKINPDINTVEGEVIKEEEKKNDEI